MREITILGLNPKGIGPSTTRNREVWTMGDYYRPFPWLRPARIYQIHSNFEWHGSPERYIDWRGEYARSGAEIIVTTPLGFAKERVFDVSRGIAEFGETIFGCTIGFAVAEAIWERVDKIELQGFKLTLGSEYCWQVPLTLASIEFARSRGVEVLCAEEERWRSGYAPTIDWAHLKMKTIIGSSACQSSLCDIQRAIASIGGIS